MCTVDAVCLNFIELHCDDLKKVEISFIVCGNSIKIELSYISDKNITVSKLEQFYVFTFLICSNQPSHVDKCYS